MSEPSPEQQATEGGAVQETTEVPVETPAKEEGSVEVDAAPETTDPGGEV